MQRFSISFGPLFVCLLLASGLWVYASMREQYAMTVEIPLDIKLPANRAFETLLPTHIRVRVQGAGWQLMNMSIAADARCVVFVQEKQLTRLANRAGGEVGTNEQQVSDQNDEEYALNVSKQMFAQGIQLRPGVQSLGVLSEPLSARVGMIAQKKVPVLPVLNVEPREGFIITGITSVAPDSVVIRMNKRKLASLKAWSTAPIKLRDVHEPLTTQVPLSDSLAGVIQTPDITPTVAINVQQMAEMTIHDVPVQLLSAPSGHDIVLAPVLLSVTVRGGVRAIERLTPSDVSAFVEYSEAAENTVGSLKPHITLPPEITVVQVNPSRLHCTHRVVVGAARLPKSMR